MNYLDEQGLNTYDTLIKSYVRGVMSERSEIPSSLMAVINGIDSKVDIVDGNIDTILSNYVTKTDLQNALANISEQPAQAVDLGLPSGLLWADRNVGAKSPYDRGLYFTYGNTVGYNVGTARQFNSNEAPGGDLTASYTPGDPVYDAARANMGDGWKTPTRDQFIELISNCTWTWGAINGVIGYTVTGTNGNSIFLPIFGYYNGTTIVNSGTYGYYWSTDFLDGSSAYALYVDSSGKNASYTYRYRGLQVRAVRTSS